MYKPESVAASPGSHPLYGGSVYHQADYNDFGLNSFAHFGSAGNSYYIVNSNFGGDTTFHKVKYYALSTPNQGISVSKGSTTQQMKPAYTPAGFLQVNTDSADNGFAHLTVSDGASVRQVAYKGDIPLAAMYKATVTNITNLSSLTVDSFFYRKDGNMVDITGYVSAVATSDHTESEFSFTLPFASNLNANDLFGVASAQNPDGEYGSGMVVRYTSDPTKGLVTFKTTTGNNGSAVTYIRFKCMYKVH
jgi:hypothetical protein